MCVLWHQKLSSYKYTYFVQVNYLSLAGRAIKADALNIRPFGISVHFIYAMLFVPVTATQEVPSFDMNPLPARIGHRCRCRLLPLTKITN